MSVLERLDEARVGVAEQPANVVEVTQLVVGAARLRLQLLDGPADRRLGLCQICNRVSEPERLHATAAFQRLDGDWHDGRVRGVAVRKVVQSGEAHVDVGVENACPDLVVG